MIRTSRELAFKQGTSSTLALEQYCKIPSIEINDEKFCYDIGSIRKDIFRLMDLGADEFRICKKVKSINPDFCKNLTAKVDRTGVQLNERFKRGIIYE